MPLGRANWHTKRNGSALPLSEYALFRDAQREPGCKSMSGASVSNTLARAGAAGVVPNRVAPPNRLTPKQGIAIFVACQACLLVDGVAVHHLGPSVGVDQLTLLRGLGSCVFVAVLALRAGPDAILHTSQPGLQLLRGALTLVSLWLVFYGLSNLPLADAAAPNYTRPFWMAVLGVVLLGEVVSRKRWTATALGFAGATFVVGPTFGHWHPAYLAALAGALVNAGGIIATRHLGRRDAPATTLAWLTAVTLLGSVTAFGKPLPLSEWPALLTVAIAGTLGVWFGLVAVGAAEVSLLAPYDYLRLPIVVLLGVVHFAEVPGAMMLFGAGLILVSGLLPLLRPDRDGTLSAYRPRLTPPDPDSTAPPPPPPHPDHPPGTPRTRAAAAAGSGRAR